MKPVKNNKRIDPRYFLNETATRGIEEGAETLSSTIKAAVPHAKGPGGVQGPEARNSGLGERQYGIKCPGGPCVVMWNDGQGLSYMHLKEINDTQLTRVQAAMEKFGYKENADAFLPDVGNPSIHDR